MNDIKIYVTSLEAGEITSRIKGYFLIDDKRFRFNGIAFGRIGGHNINVRLSKAAQKRLRDLGYDPEEIIIEVQRMMVQGDMEIINKNG